MKPLPSKNSEFMAGDEVPYENPEGNAISPPKHIYQPFHMALLSVPQIAESIRNVQNRLDAKNGLASGIQTLNTLLKSLG